MTDNVNHPMHYNMHPIETIEMIRAILNECPPMDPFSAYCLGSELKYRLRAGFKGNAQEDIEKAMKFRDFRLGKMP
jgi:hypothetical protein